MSTHDHVTDADRDRAVLYLLGELEPAEAAAFELRLRDDPALSDEVEGLRGTLDELTLVAPAQQPPDGLKQTLMQRVDAVVSTDEPLLDRADTASWEPTGFEGVDLRRLFTDASARRQTILVRMAPGASYPMHVHDGHEECYVVEGDLIDGELCMKTGDYTCFPAGSKHGPLTTRDGCLLLVQSSLDELGEG